MKQITIMRDNDGLYELQSYEKNGIVFLNLEKVARYLGFTTVATSGNEVIRWNRVKKYLQDFGFFPTSGDDGNIDLPSFIPENIFYRLAMKAKNDKAEKFQAWVADVVVPSIRKNGGYIAGQETLSYNELQKVLDVIQMMQMKLDAQKPLIDFANHVAESAESIYLGIFAKLLQENNIPIGRNRLAKWLRQSHYLMSNNTPYQWCVDRGLMELVEKPVQTAYGMRYNIQTYITGKGQIFFSEKIRQEYRALEMAQKIIDR